ncbi:hypothetical protein NC651_021515 [Populus alba x Populus x berolinensis]|nr:hypothetical protein NC651_021515 [Populus alba x Populus x berolinensis]
MSLRFALLCRVPRTSWKLFAEPFLSWYVKGHDVKTASRLRNPPNG